MTPFALQRDSDDSVLSELRKYGITQADFPTRISARNPKEYSVPIEITKNLTYHDAPLLYLDKEGVFVDRSIFSDLRTISVALLPSVQHVLIGTVYKSLPWETLVRFLLLSDIICTYIHLGSEMTITLLNEHRAEVRGTHRYFTHEENTDSFAFAIEIDHTQKIHCMYMME